MSQPSPVSAPAHPVQATPATTHHTTPSIQQPTTAPINPTTIPTSTSAPTPAPQTFNEKLNTGDRQWKWKMGLRAILAIISIIGLGCAAWVVAQFTKRSTYYSMYYDLDDVWSIPWVLITFTLSIVWSAVCILVFFLRKNRGPVHPGAQVGVDLILWLAYIPTALGAVAAVLSVASYGSTGIIGESYYSEGPWTYVQGNNTWVYNSTASGRSSSTSRSCSSSSRHASGNFENCADEDAYVNHVWQSKNARFNAELCATVCQFIALVLHLTLFIWACIDTHRRNSTKVSKDAEILAADIVQKMINTGAVIPPPRQVHMQPMVTQHPQYFQYPQYQQYPQPQQQQPQQPRHSSQPLSSPHPPQQPVIGNQPAVPSSSNEKSAGTRFA